MSRFSLEIRNLQTAVSTTFPLPDSDAIRLGKAAECEIQLEHPFVDETHAELAVHDGTLLLTDLNSRNGTAVNQLRLPPNEAIPLQPNDVIEIGLFQLTVRHESVAEEPATPTTPPPVAETAVVSASPPPHPTHPLDHQPGKHAYWQTAGQFGFEQHHSRYVQYLPALYDVPFIHQYCGIFESILEPIIWRIDTRDLLLDAQTTPTEFLDWLANWYSLTFDHTWTEQQKRALLMAAPEIYGWWGTAKALKRVLHIYIGQPVTLIDDHTMPPFTFGVQVPLAETDAWRVGIANLINAHKPAYTNYELIFTG